MGSCRNLLVSFSGGETSAFMAQWLNRNYKQLGYENIVFVFANTGLENEETLSFVDRCEKHFKIKIHWVEAKVRIGERKGTGYVITDYDGASRNGEPFESVISKYGIPNPSAPHCTRELKQAPIKSFGKYYFNGEKYDTAIGIRIDEADRINSKARENGFIYPLINKNMIPSSKPVINLYWSSMPFRLNLKGYQGNCVTCWKKSDKKLFQIAKESPDKFNFMRKMESKYGSFMPQSRIDKHIKEGKDIPTNIVFFRGNRSADDILNQSKEFKGSVSDDSIIFPIINTQLELDLLGGDSCEVFSECEGGL